MVTNMNYRVNTTDELYHHGVLGQRWGKRHGPPYPLDASSHSSSEKKAGTSGWTVEAKKEAKKSSTKSSKVSDSNSSKKTGLSAKQKTAIKIGAAAVSIALVAAGGYYLYKTGKLDSLISSGKNATSNLMSIDTNIGKDSGFNKFSDFTELISDVNPDNNHNNCYNCASTVLARLLGKKNCYALSDTMSGSGMKFDKLCSFFNVGDSSIIRLSRGSDLDRATRQILKNYADGDTGFISADFICFDGTTSGHVFNWIIKDGKCIFMDGQSAKSDVYIRKAYASILNSNKEVSIAKIANVANKFEDVFSPNLLENFSKVII